MFLQLLCNLNSNFLKKKLLGCELSIAKIGQLSIKLGLLSWWFPSLYARGHIPFGAQVQPSVTNDHHLWSLHKHYLWRSTQHKQRVDLTGTLPSLYGDLVKYHPWLWNHAYTGPTCTTYWNHIFKPMFKQSYLFNSRIRITGGPPLPH